MVLWADDVCCVESAKPDSSIGGEKGSKRRIK